MQIMSISKECRIGSRINSNGKKGTVMEIADKIKVKYDDGTYEFLSEANEFLEDTRLKSCPFCKSNNIKTVSMVEDSDRVERAFQCMKCSSRFIPEKSKYEKIKSDKCFN